MPNNSFKMCCECDTSFSQISLRYLCQSCNQSSCGKCIRGYESFVVQSDGMKVGNEAMKRIKLCKFCSDDNLRREGGRRHSEKVYPSVSPRYSPEPPSPSYDGADKSPMKIESLSDDRLSRYLGSQDCGYSPYAASHRISSSFNAHPFPISVRHSPNWSDEDDAEDSGRHYFSPSSDYCRDSSDIESSSISTRNEFFSSHFRESSPSDSPSRNDYTLSKVDYVVQTIDPGQRENLSSQDAEAILNRSERLTDGQNNKPACSGDLPTIQDQEGKVERPLDFENNGLIWFPPPPDDEIDDLENNFFAYDDEDDDIGDTGAMFSRSSSLSSMFPAKQNLQEVNKEPLRAMVQGHFRALVAQLLQGDDIKSGGNYVEDWLDVITTIAWQAANFVRPDTRRGGSMDPGDYVKVKCVASGRPHESTLIKGVVCTKNIKHKRMTSQFKNPRLLLLGGSLEYHQVANQLASFNTLLYQENDHLKTIISKIESLRPNVLLVEKSVSSCAQDYLLAKEISLVLNVKKPLLERIARCTGASLTPSIDHISTARLGHCELFRLERVTEEHGDVNQNKKLSKTLMFFEGCPKRLGCTVLLKGMCREELKKVKDVVQYAIFAAYHLSLETSFLVDEGASLPKMPKRSISVEDNSSSENPNAPEASNCLFDLSTEDKFSAPSSELDESKIYSMDSHLGDNSFLQSTGFEDSSIVDTLPDIFNDDLLSEVDLKPSLYHCEEFKDSITVPFATRSLSESELPETLKWRMGKSGGIPELRKSESFDEKELSNEYFSAADTHQSILVSFSSHCVLKGTICERSRLLRIKFYGRFDKPLGRYLRDDLFDQTSSCPSCKESAEAHVLCYTHQQGNLTINVRRLPSIKLPGEEDGKIWMWHRCLKCAQIDGVPPATPRVVMSDAAWGLSFGKFLELSFSNHATANRVATCGHSLQRDCLRFYGYGSMVAFFRYSTIDILSVNLPPSVLEFNSHVQQEWISKEASEIIGKMESLYAEISDIVDRMEQKNKLSTQDSSDSSDVQSHIAQLKELLQKERSDYIGLLQPFMMKPSLMGMISVDILELNRLRRSLLMHTHYWDHRLYSLDSLLKKILNPKTDASSPVMRDSKSDSAHSDGKLEFGHNENIHESSSIHELAGNDLHSEQKEESTAFECSASTSHQACREEAHTDGELSTSMDFLSISSYESTLSERIDCAWSGTEQSVKKPPAVSALQTEEPLDGTAKQASQKDNPQMKRVLMSPVRVHSFDSAIRMQERIRKGLHPSTCQLSNIRSFHASADYSSMLRDPVSSLTRAHSQMLPWETQKLNLLLSSTPSFISTSHILEGVRLLLPQTGNNDIVIAVYDNEPTSIIAYALNSREYDDWVADKFTNNDGGQSVPRINIEDSRPATLSAWQSFGALDLDYIHYGNYGSEDSSTMRTLFSDPKKSPHLRLSFVDESSTSGGKVKFSVTCYFAKQFDLLRKKCCPKGVDFVRSLSRCCRWSAQGGKSNVYFAKSLDERFIIKQVTRTELDSFEEFAPEYFKYLSHSLTSGSPTCLAKILGIYQVTVKHLKGGKEMKMDLMVMENLFFMRSISKVYDLKGSSRSRYNPDTSGANKVLLDLNLLEALRTKPIFLGSKAKRKLERAIWNDTSFLASIDVMDYSLLVGVDEERKELVLGIIDFMRQYTWDKQLETWVKASGILGGSKNASPTIISPKQYKKRFRKAMTAYFLTVPDQWSS
ncbi:putative 1-phosphatidylinositol-3-phosphate 5-kinase FAB1C [Cucurbita moschata]|uniref:1-phosphatidylinositol-3-phosphate 5-kinase n=1 Tax=Cucurbita moschata TaxID=3662 RepID=A0A6J1FNX0_CUCMO|nr:putative 1-phosphatidylinositol-3-phosphate 5-kinase FAB1C [Cucurbita moschata]